MSSFDQRASVADKANLPAAENVGSLSASRMGAADRLPINNTHSKSTTLSTLKKFEVIRRDKSQPDVIVNKQAAQRQSLNGSTAQLGAKPTGLKSSLNSTVVVGGKNLANSATVGRLNNQVLQGGPPGGAAENMRQA